MMTNRITLVVSFTENSRRKLSVFELKDGGADSIVHLHVFWVAEGSVHLASPKNANEYTSHSVIPQPSPLFSGYQQILEGEF